MMHLVQLSLFRSFAYPFDLGMKDNLSHSVLARRNFFHHALRVVAIGGDGEACQSGHV